ncbi:MAG TPA: hypothetical protein P5056_04185 [Candidatus Paceibacterota bacterium]|nr:hypothetical protein [Candidatus Paceibacterota bacterium]
MGWTVYFENGETLRGFIKGALLNRPLPPGGKRKRSGGIVDTSKPQRKISHISVGRLMGASSMFDRAYVDNIAEASITLKTDVRFGGVKEGKIFFVNAEDEEVAFFPIIEIKEIVK